MEKALEILKHIEELYVEDPDFSKIEKMAYANPERVNAWVEAFKNYDLSDVLTAVDEYWRYTSNKSKPTVAKLEAMLNAKKVAASDDSLRGRIFKCADELGEKFGAEARERYLNNARKYWPDVDFTDNGWQEPFILGCDKNKVTDYATKFMQRDIALNRCHHLLPMYEKAVRYVAEEMLSREIPEDVWRKIDFTRRCEKAMELGLFNEFDDVLVSICQHYNQKDYQF